MRPNHSACTDFDLGSNYGKRANLNVFSEFCLRIYERLWQLPKSFLGNALSPEMELEADIGARIIRIYAQDWKKGAVRFALLFQHHFDQYNEVYFQPVHFYKLTILLNLIPLFAELIQNDSLIYNFFLLFYNLTN